MTITQCAPDFAIFLLEVEHALEVFHSLKGKRREIRKEALSEGHGIAE